MSFTVREEVEVRLEKSKAPADNNIVMTRDMLKDIVANVLKEQKRLADATSKDAIKAAFREGLKNHSELQVNPLHSSVIE